MRLSTLTLLAAFGLFASAADLTLPAQAAPTEEGSGEAYVCADGPGQECRVQSTETCLKYTIVEMKVGTTSLISRECAEKVTTKKYYYWTKS